MSKDNTPCTADRRTFLKAVGIGTATSVVVTGSGSAQDDDSLDAQLEEVRKATTKYADPRKALDDGYEIVGPFVTEMGWQFINQKRVQKAAKNGFTLTKPQLLTYGDTGEGLDGLVLGAVGYAIPVGAQDYTEENPPDLFGDRIMVTDRSEQWHIQPSGEHVFAMQADPASDEFPESIADVPVGERLRSTHWLEITPGGKPGEPLLEPTTTLVGDLRSETMMDTRVVVDSTVYPDLLTLHAWVHHDNPYGVFNRQNPDLSSELTP